MNHPRNGQSDNSPSINWKAIIKDLSSVIILGILLIYIHYFTNPFKRGFYCNDETIRYPHKPSTVSSGLCYNLGMAVNILLIVLIEYQNLQIELKQSHDDPGQQFPLSVYGRRVYYRILVWVFGAITSEILTDISKVSVGRLRPHFITVCNPQIRLENGTNVTLNEFCQSDGPNLTFLSPDKYFCPYEKNIRDARLSFMSGHSSSSAFSAAFAVLYIQQSIDVAQYGLLKHSFQVILASTAFYVGLSRISDYKHHWQDVLTGLLQGTTVATLISLQLRPAFHKLSLESPPLPTRRNPRISSDTELQPA